MAGYKGAQGRRAQPTALKILRGNPGKRALPKNEPVPPTGEIKCPSWLKAKAKKAWREMEPVLLAMGVLTVADVPMFALLCETQAEFIESREDVHKHGTRLLTYTEAGGIHRENPSVKTASDAGKRLKALMVEFGMSPSSRTRVAVAPKEEHVDPFAEYLSGSKRA